MNWIDLAIAALVVIAALRGWSQGLLRQLGAFIGRIAGLVGGSYLAIAVAPHIQETIWRPLDVILIIAFSTVAGGLILRYFGGVFSARLHEGRLGVADSALGAGVGAVGMLVTCWFVAVLLSVVPWSSVGQSINQSRILKYVQRVLPAPPAIESRLQGILSEINVPSLFADVVTPTLPASWRGTLTTTHHVNQPDGVVTVTGYGGCDISTQGTGIVVAPDEVVTTAQLVAGQSGVVVSGHPAEVVAFDPRSDIAVVRVTSLSATPLPLATSSASRGPAQVVGFASPGDRAKSGAVYLGSVSAPGRDIYSGGVFVRTMDIVAASLNAEETGAPVMVDGRVVAVVAQRVLSGTDLDYAVPVAQVRADLARASSTTVSTQRCVN